MHVDIQIWDACIQACKHVGIDARIHATRGVTFAVEMKVHLVMGATFNEDRGAPKVHGWCIALNFGEMLCRYISKFRFESNHYFVFLQFSLNTLHSLMLQV